MENYWFSKMALEDHYRALSSIPPRCPKLRALRELADEVSALAGMEPDSQRFATFARLSDGRVVQYTECSQRDTPHTTYPDLEYLGTGEFARMEPITQA